MKIFSYLYLYILVFAFSPDLSANVVPSEISTEISVETAIKPKKTEHKPKKKKKPSKAKDIEVFLLFFLPLCPLIGFLLVSIAAPLSIMWLWITGLIILGLSSLYSIIMIILLMIGSSERRKNYDFVSKVAGIGIALLGILSFIVSVLYTIIGLVFLIWGLIAALPVLWVSGIIGLSFASMCIVYFLYTKGFFDF